MSNNIPSDLKYTKSHEWVRQGHGEAPNGAMEIGITDHAQSALGDLVFVEVPDVGRALSAGEACAVVESVKAASDIYAPLDGEVIEANSRLVDEPELVNTSPYADGWILRVRPVRPGDVDQLLDAEAYERTLES